MKQCKVVARDKEELENLIKRFKRAVIKAEVLDECKRRRFFENKALKRKEKSKRARLKAIKALKK